MSVIIGGNGTQPMASARHLFKLPALTLRPSLARLKAGRVLLAGVGEGGCVFAIFSASSGASGVQGVRGDGLPTLGDTTPVHGLAARAVM